VFPKIVVHWYPQKWMICNGKNPYENGMIWGGKKSLFSETSTVYIIQFEAQLQGVTKRLTRGPEATGDTTTEVGSEYGRGGGLFWVNGSTRS